MNRQIKDSLLSLAMILGSIIVAGGILLIIIEPSAEDRTKNDIIVDWEKVSDDTSIKQTLSWQGIPISVSARSDSWIEKNLEDYFNIDINLVFFDWNAFRNKRPLIFASGEIPDIIWDGEPNSVRNNVNNDFIMEIPYEIILKYAPTYVEMLNRHGKEAWLYAEYHGKNYGLPTFNDSVIGTRLGAYRKDWLENVGIDKVPDTLEEMEEALRRFRYNDPDKNGKKDTYGWSPAISHWSLAYSEIFAYFNILPFDFIERDGKIIWGGILPESKEALAILRRWYKEELIDPDFIVDSQQADLRLKFINGKVGYSYPIDTYNDYNLNQKGTTADILYNITKGGTMVPAKPLIGADGKRHGRSWGGAAHILEFGAHLKHNPEKIIRLLTMFEEITKSEKLYIEATSGKEGVHFDVVEGTGYVLKDEYVNNAKASWEMLSLNGFSCPIFYPAVLSTSYHERYVSKENLAFDKDYKVKEWAMQNALGKTDILPSASLYFENLNNIQQQYFAKIIIGELPLSAFDDFVKEYYAKGGEALEAEANEYYQNMQQIYKKVGAKK